ncbi:IS3 family transposase [Leuconostoc pseudomesenteroides]
MTFRTTEVVADDFINYYNQAKTQWSLSPVQYRQLTTESVS